MSKYFLPLTLFLFVAIQRSNGQTVSGWDAAVTSQYGNNNYHLIGTYQGWDPEAVYVAGYNYYNNGTLKTKRVYMGGITADLQYGRVGIGNAAPACLLDLRNNTLDGDNIAIRRNDASPNLDIYSVYSGSDDIQQGSFGYGVRPSDNAWQIWERPVGGSWSNLVSVVSGGNVGIGTSSPSQKLEVNGNMAVSGQVITPAGIRLGSSIVDNVNNAPWYGLGNSNIMMGQNPAIQLACYGGLNFQTASGQMVIRGDNGNVGIGTINPTTKLAVNGIVRAQEVQVDIDNWPDYVFTPDHQLPSLESLATRIKAQGHLPNIPSAEEVSKNGIALGEMNKKLLEKVEELTLYVIKQNEVSRQQENQIKDLKAQNEDVSQLKELLLKQNDLISQLKQRIEKLEDKK